MVPYVCLPLPPPKKIFCSWKTEFLKTPDCLWVISPSLYTLLSTMSLHGTTFFGSIWSSKSMHIDDLPLTAMKKGSIVVIAWIHLSTTELLAFLYVSHYGEVRHLSAFRNLTSDLTRRESTCSSLNRLTLTSLEAFVRSPRSASGNGIPLTPMNSSPLFFLMIWDPIHELQTIMVRGWWVISPVKIDTDWTGRPQDSLSSFHMIK